MDFLTYAAFYPNVSRETFDRLDRYAAHLKTWNSRVNLVSKSTITNLWERHIFDSTQVIHEIPQEKCSVIDLGSGAGLPGVVLAILAEESRPDTSIHMIDSDQRKCEFLRSFIQTENLSASVRCTRIENLDETHDIVTARALAPLEKLLGYASRLVSKDGYGLFLKGKSVSDEVQKAKTSWHFNHRLIPSETAETSGILKVDGISRVN